jgi:hypothetical protein
MSQQAGARYLARELQASEATVKDCLIVRFIGAPLVERLSESSIAGLAAFLELSLFEFEARYK